MNEFLLLKSIFDNIDLHFMLVDLSGKIVYCGKKFEIFFKKNPTGSKLSEIVNNHSYEELRKMMLESIFTNKQVTNTISFNDKDFYKIMIFPVIDEENKVTHLSLVAINFNNTKKLEIENEELKKKLEESNSIKSIFLSNISHELRTPMNSIIGLSDILLQNDGMIQKEHFLKSINSNAKHLDELLNNILDYAKLESNEFDLLYENFSINDLFEELNDILEDVNNKKNLNFVELKFIKSTDKKIICDYLRLKQVLYNIISNSIKFTEKGYIKISFTEEENSIIFKIEDTGIGIPEDKMKFIFDRFWQCDSTSSKKYKGTGLGLSISKSIIEMCNGKIWAESILGKGSTFYFKIPLEEMKPAIIIKSREFLNYSGKTVLIIDEVPMNYSILSIYLNSLHVNIIFSYNGNESIQIYKKQKEKIDIIFMDMKLPDMDGYELSKKLKKINKNCKIVSKSGVDFIPDKNINFHLKKPFTKGQLISILKELW